MILEDFIIVTSQKCSLDIRNVSQINSSTDDLQNRCNTSSNFDHLFQCVSSIEKAMESKDFTDVTWYGIYE